MSEEMPERINVSKVVTYDVGTVLSQLKEDGIEEPTFDDVLERIEQYTLDDFSCGHGHLVPNHELIYTDVNGNEL